MAPRINTPRAPIFPWLAALLALPFAASCSSTSTPEAPGYYISIANGRFSPLDLRAPPGATVTVLNDDSADHSVTSESIAGAFRPGAVAGISFDTGAFSGSASFALPATAPKGTVVPFYCKVHTSAMATPNGTLTIDASATPRAAPGNPTVGY